MTVITYILLVYDLMVNSSGVTLIIPMSVSPSRSGLLYKTKLQDTPTYQTFYILADVWHLSKIMRQ